MLSESQKADIGVIGLAVMGENLVLNLESRGYTVAVFNRTTERVDAFLNGRGKGKHILPAHSIHEFCSSLKSPRKILMMVKAGSAVDSLIAQLEPELAPGDILIDGGNSWYRDTERRCAELEKKQILYVGTGVSGGEEGALTGPSLMPGGSKAAWPHLEKIFKSIAAKAPDGTPCCEWIGPGGSGHFVKMVHNGIEYSDMQMISEAYLLLRSLHDIPAEELADIFTRWNKGPLESYLIEITAEILRKKDPETGRPVVDIILDCAGQKGTGKWTTETSLDLAVPAMTIAEAVFARCMSALKSERLKASEQFPERRKISEIFREEHRKELIQSSEQALYASKICSYAQGFQLLKAASEEYHWDLDCATIAAIWRGGCIIRAKFLDDIRRAFSGENKCENLLLDPFFREEIRKAEQFWRYAVVDAVTYSVPVPAFSSAIAYFDSYRSANLPANLIQAQRDFFGAHTYERVDRPRGEYFHTEWTASSGSTTSTSYNV